MYKLLIITLAGKWQQTSIAAADLALHANFQQSDSCMGLQVEHTPSAEELNHKSTNGVHGVTCKATSNVLSCHDLQSLYRSLAEQDCCWLSTWADDHLLKPASEYCRMSVR